jgi:hypothetical protein
VKAEGGTRSASENLGLEGPRRHTLRTFLARFALGVAILIAGWALVDAVTSRWSMSAGTPETSADAAKNEPPVVAFADPEPSKKNPSSRRATRSSPDPNAGELLHANTPVVIPPGSSEIGLQPAGEQPQAENRPAPIHTEREASAPGAPALGQEAPPAPGRVAPDSPVGAPATAEDEAITLEVRRKIEGAAPGRRIQVTTRNRVVTLSGAVDTEQQKTEVLDAARQTPGVERVEDRLVVLVS